uniref:Uncharacterized protein n=1 Tax=Oryza brachyantha TaxID=4533 RepID=J3NF00_ORYBR
MITTRIMMTAFILFLVLILVFIFVFTPIFMPMFMLLMLLVFVPVFVSVLFMLLLFVFGLTFRFTRYSWYTLFSLMNGQIYWSCFSKLKCLTQCFHVKWLDIRRLVPQVCILNKLI